MTPSAPRRVGALFCIVFIMALLLPLPILADPYPTDVKAEPVDAARVLVTWGDNDWADSYRVHRNDMGVIAQVPGDVNEYLDTGLTPATPYSYTVGSVVDGEVHWAVGMEAVTMGVDAPAAITSLVWSTESDYNGKEWLHIHVTCAPVEGATGYELLYRIGDAGEYAQTAEDIGNNIHAGFYLPAFPTSYWFKMRAYMNFYLPQTQEWYYITGPFSPEASIEVPALSGLTLGLSTPGTLSTLWPPFLPRPTSTPRPFLPRQTLPALRTLTPQWERQPAVTPPPQRVTPTPAPQLKLVIRTLVPLISPAPITPIQLPAPKR